MTKTAMSWRSPDSRSTEARREFRSNRVSCCQAPDPLEAQTRIRRLWNAQVMVAMLARTEMRVVEREIDVKCGWKPEKL